MSLRKLPLVAVLSMFLGSVAVAQTGREDYPSPSQPPDAPRLVPLDTSGVKAAPKPYSSSNTINANARHLIPDGGYESDFIDNVNTEAWFSTPIYHEHTYMIEVLVPFNYNNQIITNLDLFVFESDGTTVVSAIGERIIQPSLDEIGFNGSQRKQVNNYLADRFVHIQVRALGTNIPPVSGIFFHIRVIDLTQVAARWTVNGYKMFIALNNTSRGAVTGFVDYFDQAGNFLDSDSFTLPADGSTQIVRNANVPIGGALFGGIRVIPTAGSPGAITAHEYNFNSAIGQYLSFPFNPAPWRYGTPPQ